MAVNNVWVLEWQPLATRKENCHSIFKYTNISQYAVNYFEMIFMFFSSFFRWKHFLVLQTNFQKHFHWFIIMCVKNCCVTCLCICILALSFFVLKAIRYGHQQRKIDYFIVNNPFNLCVFIQYNRFWWCKKVWKKHRKQLCNGEKQCERQKYFITLRSNFIRL